MTSLVQREVSDKLKPTDLNIYHPTGNLVGLFHALSSSHRLGNPFIPTPAPLSPWSPLQ